MNHFKETCLNPSRSTFNDIHRRALWPLWFSATATANLMGGLLARPACEAAVAGFPHDHYWTVRNFQFFGGLGRLARNLSHANMSPRKFSSLENVTNVHNQWINIVWTNFVEKNMIQSKALTPRLNRCEALAFLWFHQRICQAPSPQFAAAVCEETCNKCCCARIL